MNLRKLNHLLAVIDHRNMRTAAEAVHLSQPALSRSVQALEEELGLTLLDRTYGKVSPSNYSASVVQQIRKLTSEARALQELVRRVKGLDEGEIRLGFGPFVAATVFGSVAKALIRRHPRLSLSIDVRDPPLLVESLVQGSLDLIVCDSRYLEGEKELTVISLPKQPLAFAAALDSPLHQHRNLQVEDLNGYPLAGPSLPMEMVLTLREHGFNYMPTVMCDDTHLLLDVAGSTNAVVLLPPLAFRTGLAGSKNVAPLAVTLPIEPFSYPCIVHQQGKSMGPAATLLTELIQESFFLPKKASSTRKTPRRLKRPS